MPRRKSDRVQCLVRLYEDTYKKIKAKVVDDGITVQILGEIVYNAYLKNNKEIMRLVKKRVDDRNAGRRRYALSEVERDKLLRIIEEEHSPLRDEVDMAIMEIENEK